MPNLTSNQKSKIIFVTGNQSKIDEAVQIAGEYNVEIVGKKADLYEPMKSDAIQILIVKAKDAYNQIKKPLIVDDSGIYFEDYVDFPGVFTKFVIKSLGFKGIFKLLKGTNRKAFFKTMIAYIDEELRDNPKLFEGICKGKIADKVSSVFDPNFEFNSIFIPNGFEKPFSEMSLEERQQFSHRGQTLRRFLDWYRKKT